MKKQGLPILLILMMLITPIASAFDHCASIDMSGHLSEGHLPSSTLSIDDAFPLEHKIMLKGFQNNQTDMDCHSSDNCNFHICGGVGIIASAPAFNTLTSSCYSTFEYTSPYNTVLSSELRPPIFNL